MDKIQQNIKCSLCSNRYEIVNHIIMQQISKKEYKCRHVRVEKVIH